MYDWKKISEDLAKPFPREQVSWRIGNTNAKFRKPGDKLKGLPLAYIDARDVMGRLDEVVGAGGWSDDYKEVKGRIICTITIHGISKSDGAGDTDTEGEKGGISDAFKRAAVKWGIGRYLYDVKAPKIEIDETYKTIPRDSFASLKSLLPAPDECSQEEAIRALAAAIPKETKKAIWGTIPEKAKATITRAMGV